MRTMTTPDDMTDFLDGIELDETSVSLLPVQAWLAAPAPWNPRLAFDVALGEDPHVLCERYALTPDALDALFCTTAFRREVADHQKQIREDGVTFRQKAKVQAEMYLEVLDQLVNDMDVSPATRLDAIKSTIKWADLEPKVDKAAQSSMPQFNIQINL